MKLDPDQLRRCKDDLEKWRAAHRDVIEEDHLILKRADELKQAVDAKAAKVLEPRSQ